MRRTPYKATAIEARPKQGHDATSRQMSKRTTVGKPNWTDLGACGESNKLIRTGSAVPRKAMISKITRNKRGSLGQCKDNRRGEIIYDGDEQNALWKQCGNNCTVVKSDNVTKLTELLICASDNKNLDQWQ